MSSDTALPPDPPSDALAIPTDAAAFAVRVHADASVMRDMETFRAMLASASAQINLVGPSALDQFWSRHAFDSAQLRLHAPGARSFIDVGAGAGFPGVVLAILLKPFGGRVQLVESIAKRCRFLQEVVATLDLPATVHHARAETLPTLRADVVTARACAPLTRMFDYVAPFIQSGALGLFLKGRGVEAEIAEARRHWTFTNTLIPSLSDPRGRVVSVTSLRRA